MRLLNQPKEMLLSSIEFNKNFMFAAILEAKKAANIGEIPVGAVIVKNDEIVSSAFNKRERLNNSLAHAELLAIDLACKKLGNWRLMDCELFVTLQPCLMCLGAIVNSRIKKIVYGANRLDLEGDFEREILYEVCFRNKIEIRSGILEDESANLLKKFFKGLRD